MRRSAEAIFNGEVFEHWRNPVVITSGNHKLSQDEQFLNNFQTICGESSRCCGYGSQPFTWVLVTSRQSNAIWDLFDLAAKLWKLNNPRRVRTRLAAVIEEVQDSCRQFRPRLVSRYYRLFSITSAILPVLGTAGAVGVPTKSCNSCCQESSNLPSCAGGWTSHVERATANDDLAFPSRGIHLQPGFRWSQTRSICIKPCLRGMNTQDYTGQVADLLRSGDLLCSAKLFLADPPSGLTTAFTLDTDSNTLSYGFLSCRQVICKTPRIVT